MTFIKLTIYRLILVYFRLFHLLPVVITGQYYTNHEEKPKILFISQNIKVALSQSLYVSCWASGNSPPSIEWIFRGTTVITISQTILRNVDLKHYDNRYFSVTFKSRNESRSTLIFKRVIRTDDLANLKCKADNGLGSAIDQTQISVQSSNILNSPQYQSAKLIDRNGTTLKHKNQKVWLDCFHGQLEKNVQVNWYHNLKHIDKTQMIIQNEQNKSTLIIVKMTNAFSGMYRCTVISRYGYRLSNEIGVLLSDIPSQIINITISKIKSKEAEICWLWSNTSSMISEFTIYLRLPKNTPADMVTVTFSNYKNQTKQITSYYKVTYLKKKPLTYQSICKTVKKLKPYTEYLVDIRGKNELGYGPRSENATFKTSEDIPDDPTSLTASAISSKAIRIQWKAPMNMNGKLKEYQLLYTNYPDMHHLHWLKFAVKTEYAVLSSVTKNQMYYIRVRAINNKGAGRASPAVSIFTKPGMMSECPGFHASKVYLGFIELNWSNPDPAAHQKCEGYRLEVQYIVIPSDLVDETIFDPTDLPIKQKPYPQGTVIQKNFTQHISPDEFSTKVYGVPENIIVKLTIYAYNSVGLGMPKFIHVRSAGPANKYPKLIEVPNTTSFTIFSKIRKPSPTSFNETITFYRIDNGRKQIVNNKSPLKNRPGQFINNWYYNKWTRLIPNFMYQLRLEYFTKNLTTRTTREYYYETNDLLTSNSDLYDVGQFIIKRVKYSNPPQIKLEWEALPHYDDQSRDDNFSSSNSQNKNNYVMYSLKYGIFQPPELQEQYQPITTRQTKLYLNFTDKPSNGVVYEFILSRISKKNGKSARRTLRLPDSRPSSMPTQVRIVNMSDTTATIKWDRIPPRQRNGIIIATEVEIITWKHNRRMIYGKRYKNATDFQRTTMMIDKLMLRVMYSIRLRCYSSVGHGVWSEMQNFTITLNNLPPPSNIRASRISESEIKVEWKMPTPTFPYTRRKYKFGEDISGFVVFYATRDSDFQNSSLSLSSNWKKIWILKEVTGIEIKNLRQPYFYIVRMSTLDRYHRIGHWSKPALPRSIETSDYKNRLLQNLSCCEISEYSLKICGGYPRKTMNLESLKFTYSGQSKYLTRDNLPKIDRINEIEILDPFFTKVSTKDLNFKFNLQALLPNTNYLISTTPQYTKNSQINEQYILSSKLNCTTLKMAPSNLLAPKPVFSFSTFPSNKIPYATGLYLQKPSSRNGRPDSYYLFINPYSYQSNSSLVKRKPIHSKDITLIQLSGRFHNSPILLAKGKGEEFFTDQLGGHEKKIEFYSLFHAKSVLKMFIKDDINYRSAFRACIHRQNGKIICHTSDWSSPFLISTKFIQSEQLPNMNNQQTNQQSESSSNQNDKSRTTSNQNIEQIRNYKQFLHTVVTLSITLSGILIGLISIIGGCIIHRRKYLRRINKEKNENNKSPDTIDRTNSNLSPMGTHSSCSSPTAAAGTGTIRLTKNFIKNDVVHNGMPRNGGNNISMSPPLGIEMTQNHPSRHLSASERRNEFEMMSRSMDNRQYRGDQGNSGVTVPLIQMSNENYQTTPNFNKNRNRNVLTANAINNEALMAAPDLVNIKQNSLCNVPLTGNSPRPNNRSQLVKDDIDLLRLEDYVNDLKQNDGINLMREFEQINHRTNQNLPSTIADQTLNKSKNRYANVRAADHSLVTLQTNNKEHSANHTKYINANYIDGYRRQNEFIATQGPLLETIDDFWQMVWEQRSTIIIMLVRLDENDLKKCECYWPNKGTRIFRQVEVTNVGHEKRAYHVTRRFNVKLIGNFEQRQIIHLQFLGWPDQGVPVLCQPFLSFIKLYKGLSKLDSGPVVVHCSSGVGRTGVFIALNSQMDKAKHERTVNVKDQVLKIRKQREHMVQTELHYRFLYDLLLEWIVAMLQLPSNTVLVVNNNNTNNNRTDSCVDDKELADPKHNPIGDYLGDRISQLARTIALPSNSHSINYGNQIQTGPGMVSMTGFEVELQSINRHTSKITSSISSNHATSSQVHITKNNSSQIVPFDWNRVPLSSISGIEGSEYINASFIDSFLTTRAYIVTQHPMFGGGSAVEDFWRLIWDWKCSIIVTMGDEDEYMKETYPRYWPQQKSIRYQFFVVDPIIEYDMSNYKLREFKVTDARDGDIRTIRQFHYTQFPQQHDDSLHSTNNMFGRISLAGNCPIDYKSFIEFIEQVQVTKTAFGNDSPLLVHCRYGTGKSGLFIALNNLIESIKSTGTVDIVNSVCLLKKQRVGLIQTCHQYRYCYMALLAYLAHSNDHDFNNNSNNNIIDSTENNYSHSKSIDDNMNQNNQHTSPIVHHSIGASQTLDYRNNKRHLIQTRQFSR